MPVEEAVMTVVSGPAELAALADGRLGGADSDRARPARARGSRW